MGRRPVTGRDMKIIQGQRRDEFFRKMRRKGGVARTPAMGQAAAAGSLAEATTSDEDLTDTTPMEEAEAQTEAVTDNPTATDDEVEASTATV